LSPPASATGNGAVVVKVAENPMALNRAATVTLTSGTLTRTVAVTQAAGDATLSVEPEEIPAVRTAGSYSITVTSNTAWTATVNTAATWCTLTDASATGNGTVTVNVAKNPTLDARAATVTLTPISGAPTRTVAVTQGAVPAKLCAQCCWDGTAATWVNCYVTTNAYPFDNNTTNTTVGWSGNGDKYYEGARSDRNGRANTAAISSAGMSAVQLCKDLGSGWYLPAYEELVNMSDGSAKSPLNNSTGANLLDELDDNYQSSTELVKNGGRYNDTYNFNKNIAVAVRPDGFPTWGIKAHISYVRCAWRN
jgi:hypothetical protein